MWICRSKCACTQWIENILCSYWCALDENICCWGIHLYQWILCICKCVYWCRLAIQRHLCKACWLQMTLMSWWKLFTYAWNCSSLPLPCCHIANMSSMWCRYWKGLSVQLCSKYLYIYIYIIIRDNSTYEVSQLRSISMSCLWIAQYAYSFMRYIATYYERQTHAHIYMYKYKFIKNISM